LNETPFWKAIAHLTVDHGSAASQLSSQQPSQPASQLGKQQAKPLQFMPSSQQASQPNRYRADQQGNQPARQSASQRGRAQASILLCVATVTRTMCGVCGVTILGVKI